MHGISGWNYNAIVYKNYEPDRRDSRVDLS
jgi:hypothetical protein